MKTILCVDLNCVRYSRLCIDLYCVIYSRCVDLYCVMNSRLFVDIIIILCHENYIMC